MNIQQRSLETEEFIYLCTNYPKIYKNTYWGYFKPTNFDTHIIDNRNKFINDYNIKNIAKCQSAYEFISFCKNKSEFSKFFDHIELYKTNTGDYIILISPYDHLNNNPIKLEQFRQELNFTEIYPLYHKHAITMIKIISDLKELRKETNTMRKALRSY